MIARLSDTGLAVIQPRIDDVEQTAAMICVMRLASGKVHVIQNGRAVVVDDAAIEELCQALQQVRGIK